MQSQGTTGLRGPDVKRAVEHATDADGVKYDYVDASVSSFKPRKVAGWDATDVRIRAYYVDMGRPLGSLMSVIMGLPGCRAAETVEGHDELRPQVVALFR